VFKSDGSARKVEKKQKIKTKATTIFFTQRYLHLLAAYNMSIAHISLSTGPKNFETVRAFYLAILKPLGYTVYKEHAPDYCGLMTRKGADFWLHGGNKDISLADSSDLDSRESNIHVAFNADSRKVVDEWYETAMYVYKVAQPLAYVVVVLTPRPNV